MARAVKQAEHSVKRKEILAAAQRLVFTKGYEQMSIQDILETLQISKGAFYHYFGSKQALLDGLIETLLDEGEQLLAPIVADPQLPALDKLQRYFDTAVRWKTAQKDLLLHLLRVWYADDNAIVRQKQQALALKRIAPLLAAIIHQGVEEGVFATEHPDQMALVVLSLLVSSGDVWADLLLSTEPRPDAQREIEGLIATYTEALERSLDAPAGSLHLMDAETMRQWLPVPEADARQAENLFAQNGHR